MFWIIALTWSVLGTVIFWITLSIKWARIDPLFKRALSYSRLFHPIPGDSGYLDLKFSILRHDVIFLISAALIFWVNIKWIINVVLFLNILYAIFPILRYKARKRDVVETAMQPNGKATEEIISIPVRDSFCVVIFSVICTAMLYILFVIRP